MKSKAFFIILEELIIEANKKNIYIFGRWEPDFKNYTENKL